MTTSNDFGYVDSEKNAFINSESGPIKVGSFPDGTAEEAFAFFTKRYTDLLTDVELTIARLQEGKGSTDGISAVTDRIQAAVDSPNLIGDLNHLRTAKTQIDSLLEKRRIANAERKAQLRAEGMEKRTAVVELAEKLTDSKSWKATTEKFQELLDEWKALPHAEKAVEQELWARFRKARSTFDKARKAHFEQLTAVRAEAVAAKQEIIKKAAAVVDSTEWVSTANTLKRLMSEWKALPRAAKAKEDKLWQEFKELQDRFFAAKSAHDATKDEEYVANLAAKEALLEKAEALLPIHDLEAAKKSLRAIQEQWEKAGHVPRDAKEKIERRLKAVENAVRKLQEEHWHKTNPEVVQRANGIVSSFESSLEKLDKQIAAAQAAGKDAEVAKLSVTREQTASLLEAARAGAAQFG
ncbi:MAG: DUF349 domain-containing protein [Actinobacteria bacterium]|nr:DUF349 domain-containing protein [Actinomycetota bacterium]NBY15517.1 DUF349 domain-containing protein [Actinomycetota bacterium]